MRYESDEVEGGLAAPAPDRGQSEFYIAAWRRAFHLFGVASRTEFWSFTLINLAVFVVLFVVSSWTIPEPDSGDINYLALLLLVFVLAVPIPALTVSIRRIRDVTGNGWFALLLLLTFTPFVGSIVGTLAGRKLHEAEISGSDRGYVDVWRDTPDWLGRSTRKEFWSFNLVNALVLLGVVGALTILAAVTGFPSAAYTPFRAIGPLEVMLIGGVVISTPLLPIVVRRVRDATGTGWVTIALSLISLVNPFLFVVILLCPSRDRGHMDGLSDGYWDACRKTADWGGVAPRGEFWTFTFISLLILSALGGFAVILYNSLADPYGDLPTGGQFLFTFTIILLVISYVALTIPWFPLAVRRVRDSTGSGWWLLTFLFPYIGWIIGTVLFLAPTRDESKLGPSEPSDNWTSPEAEKPKYDADAPWQRQRPGTDGQ